MEMSANTTENPRNIKGNKERSRLETNNALIFSLFKVFGIFLISWIQEEGLYTVHKIRFISFYLLWFSCPLIGLVLALYGDKIFNIEYDITEIESHINTSVAILFFAVIPAVMTYSLNLITRFVPVVLKDIALLREHDVGFKTPLTIHPFKRLWKVVNVNKDYETSVRNDKFVFVLPIISVVISVVVFITAWIIGILDVFNWSSISSDWPLFIMLIIYLILPNFTNFFCFVFVEWLLTAYEAMGSVFDKQYPEFVTWSNVDNDYGPASKSIPLDTEVTNCLGDYVDQLQKIFTDLSEGFMKFTIGINFLVFLVISVFSTVKLLEEFDKIFFIFPLSITIFHLLLLCYKANCLMGEHEYILMTLKRILQKERRQPMLVPYNDVRALRDNLLEAPPQVTIIGEYSVGGGLFVAVLGFIITYAVLVGDIMSLQQGYHSNNGTLTIFN